MPFIAPESIVVLDVIYARDERGRNHASTFILNGNTLDRSKIICGTKITLNQEMMAAEKTDLKAIANANANGIEKSGYVNVIMTRRPPNLLTLSIENAMLAKTLMRDIERDTR